MFKNQVQDLFKKAGWKEGRNLKSKFDNLSRFSELPLFLKQFLYEYGDLQVHTFKSSPEEVTATLDLTLHKTWAKDNALIDESSYYGGMKTFAIGYYDLDHAPCVCDEDGRVYVLSDAPTMISEVFKEGIEKIIMEDYENVKEWHFDVKEWKEQRF